MAKKLTADGEKSQSANKDHNTKERAKIIREAVGAIVQLKGEKGAIQEQITEVRGRVKSLGIKAAEFNVALRFFELDTEDRNESLDGLRECFLALKLGEQLNFLDAMPDAEPPAAEAAAEAPKPKRNGSGGAEATGTGFSHGAGFQAGTGGKKAIDNPHAPGSISHAEWHKGYLEGQAKVANEMAPA